MDDLAERNRKKMLSEIEQLRIVKSRVANDYDWQIESSKRQLETLRKEIAKAQGVSLSYSKAIEEGHREIEKIKKLFITESEKVSLEVSDIRNEANTRLRAAAGREVGIAEREERASKQEVAIKCAEEKISLEKLENQKEADRLSCIEKEIIIKDNNLRQVIIKSEKLSGDVNSQVRGKQKELEILNSNIQAKTGIANTITQGAESRLKEANRILISNKSMAEYLNQKKKELYKKERHLEDREGSLRRAYVEIMQRNGGAVI